MLRVLLFSFVLIRNAEVPRAPPEPRPLVRTTAGYIRGLTSQDGNYSMFLGIPYAVVNKSNVFGPALPHPEFEGVLNADDDSARCPQYKAAAAGSLACLQLNVFAPARAAAPRPVAVYIHGGYHTIGSKTRAVYGPKFLMRHDIIVVSINYRLGPYGFMCLGVPEAIGNQGLKDQLIALRWVKSNIASFGGDVDKITIQGHSSGAQSVDYHLYFRKENLFSRAILQGGNVEFESATREPNTTAPFLLAERLNYTTRDLRDALAYLSSADPHDVILAVEAINLTFGPCVEKLIDGADNYVTEHPVNAVPNVKDVDILIGFNNDENYRVFLYKPETRTWHPDYVEKVINSFFDFKNNEKTFTEMKNFVTEFYMGDMTNVTELERQVGELVADFNNYHGTLRSMQKYVDNGAKALYWYMFSYDGGRNFLKHLERVSGGGARHGDELGYLFDIALFTTPLNKQDELIIDRMTRLWTNFVKYGDPTPEPLAPGGRRWARVRGERGARGEGWRYLELGRGLRLGSRPFPRRMAFLDLFFSVNERYRRGYKATT